MNIILTGTTGMVGEGVLLECLANINVSQILIVSRKSTGRSHPKLKELILPDFFDLDTFSEQLTGYDTCFYCAGISSVGLDEVAYTRITYETTIYFATILKRVNPKLIFNYVSGSHTDSTEKGRVMWARVKGKTENALLQSYHNAQYNFRPALMKPSKGQVNFKGYNKAISTLYPILSPFFPSCTLRELGMAMINAVRFGYSKVVLEVKDIKVLSAKDAP